MQACSEYETLPLESVHLLTWAYAPPAIASSIAKVTTSRIFFIACTVLLSCGVSPSRAPGRILSLIEGLVCGSWIGCEWCVDIFRQNEPKGTEK